ncbi:MAG: flagellar hook capping FlgD N-terminal domain-containing protein [Sulfuricurvum sp.]|jgi:flagellar basal-body rod modification protein FlgD
MAITSTGENAATHAEYESKVEKKDKSVLGKDDFLKLLLVELQYQDPTAPMDSEKILSQTSQLATLESANNTNKALEELAAALGSSQQFNTIAAIGKMADIGSNAIIHEEGKDTTFDMYFQDDVKFGSVEILDGDGNILKTLSIDEKTKGVYQFDWDGTDGFGNSLKSGIYYVTASYTNQNDEKQKTRMGAYPIESVKFDGADTYVKLGSSYVKLEDIKEVY